MAADEEPFVRRWSRRKLATREDVAGTVAQPPESDAKLPAETASDAPLASETEVPPDLPDIDSLDKDSDYTAFLREDVPEVLKNLALRKLWRSDPLLANLDGLNDYDDDFKSILESGSRLLEKMRQAEEVAKKIEDPVQDDADQIEAGGGETLGETPEAMAAEHEPQGDDEAGAEEPEDESPGSV